MSPILRACALSFSIIETELDFTPESLNATGTIIGFSLIKN